jgi:nitrogenase molybdenum-iron protein alpha/beta subunit
MKKTPYSITAQVLADAGRTHIPPELVASTHLIYSSPATLAFNSPGAQGFGVKRAGLSIPGSVMLLVAPGCCGRNTTVLSQLGGYSDKFFYLLMNDNDIVTGKHLNTIPQAVNEICQALSRKPSAVMICITCVDALLGTDMARVCRKASALAGLPVLPCYMYALTREGRNPPMSAVRQSIYSLLEPQSKHADMVNILGYFAPLNDACELYALLRHIGIRQINEISRCRDFSAYMRMSQANFNLILNPEVRLAADEMEKKLHISAIELTRMYQIDKIHKQYQILAQTLDTKIDDTLYYEEARAAIEAFVKLHNNIVIAVGSVLNANSFELALALTRYGLTVAEIYSEPGEEDFFYIKKLAQLSPETKIYTNMSPSMLHYERNAANITLTIGTDAEYYHPACANVPWNQESQPFGYQGLKQLFTELRQAAAKKINKKNQVSYGRPTAFTRQAAANPCLYLKKTATREKINGLRLYLSPFAPDQSGASAVFYGLGGIVVICDAGGCAGNICGFDEPRWFTNKTAIFSAGLRDMDAILGRDDKLITKLCNAKSQIEAKFAVILGTPVPAVIGTDYKAIKRMAEHRLQIPVLTVDTNGTALYDTGEEKAYLELFTSLAQDSLHPGNKEHILGVIGATPLDTSSLDAPARLQKLLKEQGWTQVCCYGADGSLDAIRNAGMADKNLVIAPAGLKAAHYLKQRFGTPFEVYYPLVQEDLQASLAAARTSLNPHWKKILIIHQQVMANTLRNQLRRKISAANITTASWFMLKNELKEPQDIALTEEYQLQELVENEGYDCILADHLFQRAIPTFPGNFIDLPHFAVSGKI